MTFEELKDFILSLGEKQYRTAQIFEWIYRHNAKNFDEMDNIPKCLQNKLSSLLCISKAVVMEKHLSVIDNTSKYLLELSDGSCVESVVMQYEHGYSICISSQVGCRMGCDFCASTKVGWLRNLTCAEMLDQVVAVINEGFCPSNIVMMGIGEPLDNYENVLKFLSIVNDHRGFNIGKRHLALSTCGLVDKIYDLAEKNLGYMLSISLHAVDDSSRSKIMPINNVHNIAKLLGACTYYTNKTGRRISFQYAMIKGLNDSHWHAKRLSELLRGVLCYVNLIPINPISNFEKIEYKRSDWDSVVSFRDTLMECGLTATIRRELGSDIGAACGQLRSRQITGIVSE